MTNNLNLRGETIVTILKNIVYVIDSDTIHTEDNISLILELFHYQNIDRTIIF